MTSEESVRSTTERIMAIAKDNTMASIVIAGIAPEKMNLALTRMETYGITREMVNCFWTHECGRDRAKFDDYLTRISGRPSGCAFGCLWEAEEKDESEIFGPTVKSSFRDCAMEDCEHPSQYFCSNCYCVRYCSPLCQRMDHKRHRGECKRMVDAVDLLKSRGEIYAKRTIKNNVSISDESWTRLWKKHGGVSQDE